MSPVARVGANLTLVALRWRGADGPDLPMGLGQAASRWDRNECKVSYEQQLTIEPRSRDLGHELSWRMSLRQHPCEPSADEAARGQFASGMHLFILPQP